MLGTNNGNIRRTTNGGSTWTAVTNPPGIPSFAVNDMHSFKDGSNLIRIAMSSANVVQSWLYKTTDYGLTWIQETLPTSLQANPIQHMAFVNQTLGYAGCAGGIFVRYNGPSGISQSGGILPSEYKLEQNYPNPFNPSTKINYSIPVSSKVTLKIYNTLGNEVSTLVNEFKSAGNYSAEFTAGSLLNSGVYFYTLTAGDFVSAKKFILLK
ncbi:MAG: T9SS type A sorting domain-containing protein [Bacteroidetes bacterium]|nr:T9SS type A sorting domain-containing protein [Bacteroidota bacterium]